LSKEQIFVQLFLLCWCSFFLKYAIKLFFFLLVHQTYVEIISLLRQYLVSTKNEEKSKKAKKI